MRKSNQARGARSEAKRTPETVALGQRLKKARESAGLTVELAAKSAGVSKNHLYVLERGEAMPTLPTLGRLARAYGVTRDALLSGRIGRNGNGNGRRK